MAATRIDKIETPQGTREVTVKTLEPRVRRISMEPEASPQTAATRQLVADHHNKRVYARQVAVRMRTIITSSPVFKDDIGDEIFLGSMLKQYRVAEEMWPLAIRIIQRTSHLSNRRA